MKVKKVFESSIEDDISDLFLPIIDMGCIDYTIHESSNGNIDISWVYKINLSCDFSDLERHKNQVNTLHSITSEVYEILDRLSDMNFKVDFYDIDFNMGSHYKQANFDLTLIQQTSI